MTFLRGASLPDSPFYRQGGWELKCYHVLLNVGQAKTLTLIFWFQSNIQCLLLVVFWFFFFFLVFNDCLFCELKLDDIYLFIYFSYHLSDFFVLILFYIAV